MDRSNALEFISTRIRGRFAAYQGDRAFEEWMYEKAGTDPERIDRYLELLNGYGYLSDAGRLSGDYDQMPHPDRLHDDIAERLGRLSSGTLHAIRAASVEGRYFSAEALAAMLDSSPADAVQALQPAVDIGLIQQNGAEPMYSKGGNRYRFRPLQAREIVYEGLQEEDALRLHEILIRFLKAEMEQADDRGTREMLNSMIEEHNLEAIRPR